MGVPESIQRYLDLSLAVVRLARVVLWTKSDEVRIHVSDYTPSPNELRLVEDDTIPLHLGEQSTSGKMGEYMHRFLKEDITHSSLANRPRPLPRLPCRSGIPNKWSHSS